MYTRTRKDSIEGQFSFGWKLHVWFTEGLGERKVGFKNRDQEIPRNIDVTC